MVLESPNIRNDQPITGAKSPKSHHLPGFVAQPIVANVCCDASTSKGHAIRTGAPIKSAAAGKILLTKKPPASLLNKSIYLSGTGPNWSLLA